MTIRKHYRLQRAMTILQIIAGAILSGIRIFNISIAAVGGTSWIDRTATGTLEQ